MPSLFESFRSVVAALGEASVPFAVCGGIAMSIHERPRATIDIDLLAPADQIPRLVEALRPVGFVRRDPTPTRLAQGQIVMHQQTRVVPGHLDVLILDVIEVGPSGTTAEAWAGREVADWEGRQLSVVSPEGLIALKRLRNSAQDQADIEALESL